MRRSSRGFVLSLLVCAWLCGGALVADAQTGAVRVDYTVQVANIEEQMFHVTADVQNLRQKQLNLSLPTWTPGWYTVENYAKNLLRFRITDERGAPVPFVMTRKQTWTVDTQGRERLRVEFDYRATTLALNQAKITRDFAFFTGTQLFLEAEGHRQSPSQVRFQLPPNWKIISALKETADPLVFTAPDYDTLVDAPTEMGNFDVMPFTVEGKPHFFVSTPAGAFSREKSDEFVRMLARVASTEGAIFGGLPYEKYVHFYFFARPESNAGGALEHLNSYVAFAPAGPVAMPDRLISTAAHEFFHLWNVKRIRPAEMWPYDYSRENETPLLWVSEGITNYYTNVALHRAGLRTREQFYESVTNAINEIENNEASKFISSASASASTWICYDTPCAFDISYYTTGQNLGALLDLSILHDTGGVTSLDDVMRTLYRDFYLKGRGFTTADLVSVINRLTRRDYADFFRRYVAGVEVPRYEEIFGFAGLRFDRSTRKRPIFGLDFERSTEGIRITHLSPTSPFAEAGAQQGDILQQVDSLDVLNAGPAIFQRLGERIGQKVKIVVKRGERTETLDLNVRGRDETVFRLTEVAQPTPEQMRVREAWLKAAKANAQTSRAQARAAHAYN